MSRTSTILFDLLPPPLSMRLAAWKNWCMGERELRELPRIVPRRSLSIDVGAHRGVYAYHLARLAHGVVAYEPNPDLASYLRRAFDDRVAVRSVALGNRHGAAVLSIPLVAGTAVLGWAKVVEKGAEAGPGREVAVERLDDENLLDVGFIKIDVEGNEEAVLRGGEQVIRRDHPVLLVEIEQRHLARPMAEIFALIGAMGYRGYFLHQAGWAPVERLDEILRADPSHADPGSRHYVNNFLFWPHARGEAP